MATSPEPNPIRAIEGNCVHFTGVFGYNMEDNPCCAAGVNYRELVGGGSVVGWVRKLPCLLALRKPPFVVCSKMCLPTAEEVATYKVWQEARLGETDVAVRCHEHAAGKRGVAGTIECPVCKGKLNYSVASSNGHLWGACETEDCLRWMQ